MVVFQEDPGHNLSPNGGNNEIDVCADVEVDPIEESQARKTVSSNTINEWSMDIYKEVRFDFVDFPLANPYIILGLAYRGSALKVENVHAASQAKIAHLIQSFGLGEDTNPALTCSIDRIEQATSLLLHEERKEAFDNRNSELINGNEYKLMNYGNGKYEGQINPEELARYRKGGDCALRHGDGVTMYKNGSKYEGQYYVDFMHGYGMLFWPNGDLYRGGFCRNMLSGRGEYFYESGAWYVGRFEKGQKHGQGTMFWAQGTRYQGQFEKDLMHGKGRMETIEGRTIEGEWVKGKEHGQVKMVDPMSAKVVRYEGHLDGGIPQGSNITISYADGGEYCGEMRNGYRGAANPSLAMVKEARVDGSYSWNNGTVTFFGRFEKDKPVSGMLVDNIQQMNFEGQWKKNAVFGYGKLELKAKKFRYEGDWLDGKKHGKGECTWLPSAGAYLGAFRDDKLHGHGTYTTSKKKESWDGEFADDHRHGVGIHRTTLAKGKLKEWKERFSHGKICMVDGRLCISTPGKSLPIAPEDSTRKKTAKTFASKKTLVM